MARQNLRLREAAIAIQELLDGEPTIDEISDFLEARGFIRSDAESIREWKHEQTRNIIQQVRRYTKQDESGKVILVSLSVTNAKGQRRDYWKDIYKLTTEEAALHLNWWLRHTRGSARRFHEDFKILAPIHGKRKLQRLLDFPIPVDPEARVPVP